MANKPYAIQIVETRRKTVYVESNSMGKAEEEARRQYAEGEINLEIDDIDEADFVLYDNDSEE